MKAAATSAESVRARRTVSLGLMAGTAIVGLALAMALIGIFAPPKSPFVQDLDQRAPEATDE